MQFYLLAYLVRFAMALEPLHRFKGSIVMLAVSLDGPFSIFACAALLALVVMQYFLASTVRMLFWWSLALSALTLFSRQFATGLALAAVIVISVLTDAPLRRPPLADLSWPRYAARIQAGVEFVVVPINPAPWAFGVAGNKRNTLR